MLEAQRWHPTHVQVTVLQAQRLHPKGKHGTNDAYAIIQLGREKYSTSVVEKSLSPVWREEAAFQLLPDPERCPLQLTIMHRSLLGPDRFLGQVTLQLHRLCQSPGGRSTQWYRLESKPGKRRKERGQLQLSVHFMRSNMTASMFDLSMKGRSPFSRLKEKMKGRNPDGTDTSSAILPAPPPPPDHAPTQPRGGAKKPFLLGPQRLSSAHSMSDLMAPPTQNQQTPEAQENGGLKSPHRRTLSADTSEEPGGERTGGTSTHLPLGTSVPQKFATLPRQWAPGDERGESRRKRDKISLLGRVTGKRDAQRHSQDWSSEGPGDALLPPTNPFRSHAGGQWSDVLGAAPVGGACGVDVSPALHGSQEEGPGVFGHMTRLEVERELLRHRELLRRREAQIRELEDYIDNLLVRVMEETPGILRVPYIPSRRPAPNKSNHS